MIETIHNYVQQLMPLVSNQVLLAFYASNSLILYITKNTTGNVWRLRNRSLCSQKPCTSLVDALLVVNGGTFGLYRKSKTKSFEDDLFHDTAKLRYIELWYFELPVLSKQW